MLEQSPGPATILSTHPSINVVVGSGFTVGSPYEHSVRARGHSQISVVCGPVVVTTVLVAEQTLWPGSDVCLALSAELVVQVGQLPQPGLLKIFLMLAWCQAEVYRVIIRFEKRGRLGGLTSTVAVQAPAGATVVV